MNTDGTCTCDCHVKGVVQFDFVPCCEHCYVQFADIRAEEFIAAYCLRSKIPRAEYDERFVCMPCTCGEKGCKGWATVTRDDVAIKYHAANCGPQFADQGDE